MTTDLKIRRPAQAVRTKPARRSAGDKAGPLGIGTAPDSAVVLKLRGRHSIPIARDQDETFYIVASGIILLVANPQGERRSVIALLYPGDVLTTLQLPPGTPCMLLAATPGELWRMRACDVDAQRPDDVLNRRTIQERLTNQAARLAMSLMSIGTLTGPERVATCLLELACHTGVPMGRGLAFDNPLKRSDMAELLSLNADTLSRIMSRFRESGLLTQTGRVRLNCPSLEALRKETPLADTVTRLHTASHLET